MGAEAITEPHTPTEQWLVQTVSRQAQAAGIAMPEVAVYDSPEVNAFATGMRKNAALVAVSTGLLERMTREEAEAVLGHEVSHVANGDMVTLALIQGVVNTFVLFLSRVIGHVVDRVVFRTERGQGPAFFVTMIVAELVLGILASIIVMWFSRQREFRADRGGARLAGRQHMVAALRRLASLHAAPLMATVTGSRSTTVPTAGAYGWSGASSTSSLSEPGARSKRQPAGATGIARGARNRFFGKSSTSIEHSTEGATKGMTAG